MADVDASRCIRADATTSEDEWRRWLAELSPPLCTFDELRGEAQRLVVVSPHPDDEVLACGGLIALSAKHLGATALIAVTDGEASHRGDPSWSATRLAAARRVESGRGLERLGLFGSSVTRLSLPDSQVATTRGALSRALRRLLKPTDWVITTWRHDGHPDHDATGAITADACNDIGCNLLEAPVWMWQWSTPSDDRVPWHRLRTLLLPPDARARKDAALAEHATQLTERAGQAPVLGPDILARAAREAEYFFVQP